MHRTLISTLLLSLLCSAPVRAGLYYSGETYNELPSRWSGFLLDGRALRQCGVKPKVSTPGSMRHRYEQEAARLAKQDKLTADESADLGALYLRLGESQKALAVLRAAQREQPVHFRLAANLGTAWQMNGDLAQASITLATAVKLAPGKHVRAEQLHLRLVRQRQREKVGTQTLDDLFDIRYLASSGKYEPASLAPAQRKALPTAAVALTQQLALWLPNDARLLWQVAELANAHGDVATAAAIMDGCVTEFGLRDPDLLAHRKIVRAAAEKLAKKDQPGSKEDHKGHALLFAPRSSRPLVSKSNLTALPPIDPNKTNVLAWEVIGETTIDRQTRPTFPKYLKELDGKQVELYGHMQPIGDDGGLGAFLLIEHPVGCWYCEMPELTYMVLVEMPEGKSARYTRERVKVTGKLSLNSKDPENFLYLVRDAKVE